MRMQLCTWPEVEGYLEKSTGIIMPIGSTEQHGPTGLIGTDAICPELIADGIAAKSEIMIAPTINVGMAQHHLGFPGSMALRPSTLIAVIVDCVTSLARHGFDRFFFINGHGGNTPTMQAAFSQIYAERSFHADGGGGPQVRCDFANWWKIRSVKKLADELFGEGEGFHATPSEVALTYYGYPEIGKRVHQKTLEPRLAPTGQVYDAEDFRRRFPDGRMGSDPTLATPEIGKRFLDAAVEELGADYKAFVGED